MDVKKLAEEIIKKIYLVDGASKEITKLDKKLASVKWHIDDNNEKIKKSIISLILTASIMAGGGVGLQKLAKRLSYQNVYTKNTEVYSTIDGKTKVTVDNSKKYGNQNDEVKVRVYEPYTGDKSRNYIAYDVYSNEFETAKDYYEFGLDNYINENNKIERTLFGKDISKYKDSYTEVEMVKYDFLDYELVKGNYYTYLVLFGLWYALLLYELDDIYGKGILSRSRDLIDNIKKSMEEHRINKELLLEMEARVDEILQVIDKNEELRLKFNIIYEDSKDLFNDLDNLYEKVNDVEYLENIKRLVKYKN